MAQVKNCKLVDPDRGLFNVLDLAYLRLTGPWWWESEDIDEEGCIGSIFRTWGDGEATGLDKAYIIVADVTDDLSEPDISEISIQDVERVDHELHTDIARGLEESGSKLIKWIPSKLNESTNYKALVTPYITLDQGKERQFIVLRISAQERKLVVMGCFDVKEHETFAGPILAIMKQTEILR
jgi:hypothetical protein